MDDASLWERFHARTLSSSDWTHVAHLRVAWLFLDRYPMDEAHLLMRVGIIRLNATHGLEETPARGYHETLTRVWLAVVAAARATSTATSSDVFVAEAAEALTRDAPLRYYSRERIMSVAARATFVAPDIAPLPGAL